MRLLSREGMRDVDIGICWDAGYIGICGIGGEDGGYAVRMGDMRRYVGRMGDMWDGWGICGDMWDGPPPRNRPGRAAVFWSTPQPI